MGGGNLSPVQIETLRFFDRHDIALKPASLAANMDYERGYLARACKNLSRMGYLEDTGDAVYQITDRGRAYLRGELDADGDGDG